MYNIVFGEPSEKPIKTSSNILEDKLFSKLLHQNPSDRHAYSLKLYSTPIRYTKNF
jgi:hypothetical protein